MSDTELSRLLSEFEESAKKLNAASDSINTIITDIEQKLVSANAGLECWIEDRPVFEADPVPCQIKGRLANEWTQTLLGFVKLNQTEGWRLAVKERQVVQVEGEDDQAVTNVGARDALWKAPRNVRINALELIPELVGRLHLATERALEAIDQAKKIAQAKAPGKVKSPKPAKVPAKAAEPDPEPKFKVGDYVTYREWPEEGVGVITRIGKYEGAVGYFIDFDHPDRVQEGHVPYIDQGGLNLAESKKMVD